MKKMHTYLPAVLALLILASIAVGGNFYFSNVRSSLWELSVGDLKEVTAQCGHGFEIYLRKDLQSIHGWAVNLSQVNSDDVEYFASRIEAFNDVSSGSFYTIVDMGQEVFYSNITQELCNPLSENRLDMYRSFTGSGVEEPYVSDVNGLKNIGCYECFTFADGVPGIVRRSRPLSEVADEFSLSVFDGQGFSYIISGSGDILVRSGNSSDDYANIFDIMRADGEEELIADFRGAVGSGRDGVLRFTSAEDGNDYIYAYSPIDGTDGWYLISVVPDEVVSEQSSHILRLSGFFVLAVCGCGMILLMAALFIRQTRKAMKKADLEVRYREQLFNAITGSTGDVFVMYTVGERHVEYVSPNIVRVLGISAEKVMEDLTVLRSRGEADPVFTAGIADLEPGKTFSMEQERVHGKTGERRWFFIMVYRVTIDEVDKVILVFSDRTAEKQKEQTLKDAMTIAQEANRSKGNFLNNMSHDMRTPMNAIVGLCTLLKRDFDKPDLVCEHTRKITASSQHLLSLINDVLDMSKIESGKTTLNITEISLAEIIDSLDTIIRPQAQAKNQKLEIYVSDIKSEHLLGDGLRINQIFINILSNAVKYTPEGGTIELAVRELPRIAKNFAGLRFTVRDNGIGMSPEYLKTIFKPFTREVNSATNKIPGTGLGMPITKSLVELMGGTISVESEAGRGSVFTVDLELRIQEQTADPNFWQKHGVTRALVVDDEADVCASVIGAMEGTGVSMQSAQSGPEAISAVRQAHDAGQDFDLVLLDWKMPEMDGVETAGHIRSLLPQGTPILVLTAYDWRDIENEARAAGIDDFLPKPFFFSNFKLTVERLKENREAAARREAAPKQEPVDTAGLHVLAAEDNELNSEILIELLDIIGITCDVAKDGKEALERFGKSAPEEYDLILMDIQMPNMNGYEATRAIRACEHPRAGTVPIIAMTANAFAEDVQKALDAGMNRHISKPIDLDKLKQYINEVVPRDKSVKANQRAFAGD